jgi:hypothetical protein
MMYGDYDSRTLKKWSSAFLIKIVIIEGTTGMVFQSFVHLISNCNNLSISDHHKHTF